MTPAYALRRLLELEPLTWREIARYTGWPHRKVWSAIESLQDVGQIVATKQVGTRRNVYGLPPKPSALT